MKKFLCSLAILATLSGVTSFSMAKTFDDVKGTKYEDSIDILTELNIASGYDDGTYKPENSVKRVEMAKFLIVMMGKEDSAKSVEGKTNFSDILSKHAWATGYINLASSLGIIKGYPDGTFRPDEPVSYVEAVTMLLRALGYDDELDSLSWPTGYMSEANSAGILKNITASSSSDKANRGNIAEMILNTLSANTRKLVSTNGNTKLYEDDIPLIEKAFANYKSVKDGIVSEVDVEDKIITVEDDTNDRKMNIEYKDSNIKEMLGREISFIYNTKDKTYLIFNFEDNKKVKYVYVDYIDEDDNVLIDEDGNEYDLPKSSNIQFIGTTHYEDVETAYITLDNNKVTHMLLEGAERLYVGLVEDNSVAIGDEKGIGIVNLDGKYEEVLLSNSKNTLKENDVIIYTYEDADEINYKKVIKPDDALMIDKLTETSIALEDEDKITFKKESEYQVVLIDYLKVSFGELDDIDEMYDTVVIEKINNKYYIIVFLDGIDDYGTSGKIKIYEKEVNALKSLLSDAKAKKESSYSEDSWESFEKVYKSVKDDYEDLVDVDDLEDYDDDEIDDEIDYVIDLKESLQKAMDKLLSRADEIKRTNALNRITKWFDAVSEYSKSEWNDTDPVISWSELTKKKTEVDKVLDDDSKYTIEELQALANELEDYIIITD